MKFYELARIYNAHFKPHALNSFVKEYCLKAAKAKKVSLKTVLESVNKKLDKVYGYKIADSEIEKVLKANSAKNSSTKGKRVHSEVNSDKEKSKPNAKKPLRHKVGKRAEEKIRLHKENKNPDPVLVQPPNPEVKFCLCGCGSVTKNGADFIRGHSPHLHGFFRKAEKLYLELAEFKNKFDSLPRDSFRYMEKTHPKLLAKARLCREQM